MFFPEGHLRVYLYGEPVDMRKSFDGLYALVRNGLKLDPLSGHLFAFVNRRATQIRVLYFDRSGWCLWAKRLEAGRFIGDWSRVGHREMDCTGLKLLPGEVARIDGGEFNNGWADVRLEAQTLEAGSAKQKPLLLKTAAKTFYFNHGYQINTNAKMQETGYTTTPSSGPQGKKLLAYFVRDNLCGIQFHPEKSQAAGLAFIANTMKHYGF